MNKFAIRTISGIVYVLLILAGLLINRYVFTAVFGVITILMICEFVRISGKSRILPLGIVYILASMAVLYLLDRKLLLCFFIMIWSSDVGAYCIGSTIGKKFCSRKLAPTISPNKSWAGFWGGLVFNALATIVLHYTGLLQYSLIHCIVLSLVIHCAGVCGDLLESAWKRHYGIKDSGNSIPGHGGWLDRLDSSLLAIPAGALYLLVFQLI